MGKSTARHFPCAFYTHWEKRREGSYAHSKIGSSGTGSFFGFFGLAIDLVEDFALLFPEALPFAEVLAFLTGFFFFFLALPERGSSSLSLPLLSSAGRLAGFFFLGCVFFAGFFLRS
jgi:hypothetical protein